MVRIPYIDYDTDDMILRDFLALHRTILANERTLLSYSRTGLTFSVAGVTLFKLFTEFWIQLLGLILTPMGIIILFLGLYRFLKTRVSFSKLELTDHPHPVDVSIDEDII